MNHTPGPWKFALFDADPNQAFVQWKSGYAAVHGAREGREANAILIAAAPEMLEALRGMCNVWVSVCGAQSWEPQHMSQYTIALDMIAKAEGKS